MISAARPSTIKPAASDAAATAASAAPATGGEAPVAPFDALLTQEAQAASATPIDVSGLNAPGTPELDDVALTQADDADDDSESADSEGSLAFLASLLNAAALTPRLPATGTDTGEPGADPDGKQAGIDDALGVCAKPTTATATATAPDPAASTPAQPANPASTAANVVADASLAAKLLAAAGNPTDSSKDPAAARLDAAAADTDASAQGVARAAELFAHNMRHPVAANEHATIATPVRDPRWADDLGTRIALMVRGGESSASLQLSPPDLGPLDVNVTVRDSQATIHFGAAQAETRAMLEASIPRLREMLAAQGFQLMDASVSQGFARQSRQESGVPSRTSEAIEVEVRAAPGVQVSGLLDLYA